MDTCFEDATELVDFFNEHEAEMKERYKKVPSIEKSGSAFRQKSHAHFVVRDYMFDKGLTATDCQINKMAEMIIIEILAEKYLKNSSTCV